MVKRLKLVRGEGPKKVFKLSSGYCHDLTFTDSKRHAPRPRFSALVSVIVFSFFGLSISFNSASNSA